MGRGLTGAWQRFLQNAEQLDRRGLPCSVEDYINDETIIYGPGNAQLAELIPGLLTSLGILGTFIGLTRGMSKLDFSNSAALMSAIPTLLEGMKYAFETSVAGIVCSLAFSMLNRMAVGSSFKAIDDFSINTAWNDVLGNKTDSPVVIQVCISTNIGVESVFRVVVLVTVKIVFVVITNRYVVVKQVHTLIFWCDAKRPFLSGRFQFFGK